MKKASKFNKYDIEITIERLDSKHDKMGGTWRFNFNKKDFKNDQAVLDYIVEAIQDSMQKNKWY